MIIINILMYKLSFGSTNKLFPNFNLNSQKDDNMDWTVIASHYVGLT